MSVWGASAYGETRRLGNCALRARGNNEHQDPSLLGLLIQAASHTGAKMSQTRRRQEERMRSRVCSFAQCLDDHWIQQELEDSGVLSSPRHPSRLQHSSNPSRLLENSLKAFSASSKSLEEEATILHGHETFVRVPVELNSRRSSDPTQVSPSQHPNVRRTLSAPLLECPFTQNC